MIPTASLLLLASRPDHGYSLVQRLKAAGFWHAQAGSVYSQLRAMESRGLISASWDTESSGPPRKVFSVTALGREALERQKCQIERSMYAFSRLSEGRDDEDPQ